MNGSHGARGDSPGGFLRRRVGGGSDSVGEGGGYCSSLSLGLCSIYDDDGGERLATGSGGRQGVAFDKLRLPRIGGGDRVVLCLDVRINDLEEASANE